MPPPPCQFSIPINRRSPAEETHLYFSQPSTYSVSNSKVTVAPGDVHTPEPSTHHEHHHHHQHQHEPSREETPTTPREDSHLLSHPARAHQFLTNPPLTLSQIHPSDPLRFFHAWFNDPRLPPAAAPETATLATAQMPSGRVSARVVYLKELDERGFVVYSNWGSREGKGGQVFGSRLDGGKEGGSGSGGNTGDGIGIPTPGPIESTEGDGENHGNKWAALTFNWSSVERQVRIEGLIEPLSREESEIYWRTRERGSQIGGWASWQSRVLWSSDSSPSQGNRQGQTCPAADIDDGRAELEQRVRNVEARFAGVEQIPLPPFWGGVRLVPESVEFWQGRRSRLHDRFRYVRVDGEDEGDAWRIERLSP